MQINQLPFWWLKHLSDFMRGWLECNRTFSEIEKSAGGAMFGKNKINLA